MDSLDRIFQARREVVTGLAMDPWRGERDSHGRREKVDVDFRGKSRKRGEIEKRARCSRKRTSRKVDVRFVGKYQESQAGHTLGIREGQGDAQAFFLKPFATKRRALFAARFLRRRLTFRYSIRERIF